ncbi:hypothetical protein A2U01_0067852, partial [Trifolium medium]|nr:hypothetical protein [Trifolium medium]
GLASLTVGQKCVTLGQCRVEPNSTSKLTELDTHSLIQL